MEKIGLDRGLTVGLQPRPNRSGVALATGIAGPPPAPLIPTLGHASNRGEA